MMPRIDEQSYPLRKSTLKRFTAWLLVAACALPSTAAALSWDGDAGNGLWSDPLNWSGDTLPTSTSEVVIDVPGAIVTLDVDFTLLDGGRLRIDASGEGATLVVNPGIRLTFNNEGQGVNVVQEANVLSNFGTVEILTGFTAQLRGNFINEAGGVLNIGVPGNSGGMFASGVGTDETLVNHGTVNLNGVLDISSIVANHGTFNFGSSSNSLVRVLGGANFGTFLNAASGTVMSSMGVGRIQVGAPFFTTSDTLRNEGNFTFGGTIELHQVATNAGVMDLTDGTLDIACGAELKNTGTLTLGTVHEDCKLWDGDANDGLWSNPMNWSLDRAPTSEDNIQLGENDTVVMAHLDVNFEVGANRTLENIGRSRLEPEQGTLHIDPGVTLTVNGRLENSHGHLINNGTIVNNGSFENTGHQNINTAIFDNNGVLTNNGTLENAGSPSSSSTNVAQHGVFNNNGTINNIGNFNNTSGTFTSSFSVIDNPGTISNGSAAIMVLECTELTGNAVTGEPPTIIPCNEPPVADAGPDQLLECTGTTTSVLLDGTASFDADGDTLSYLWAGPFGTIGGVSPSVQLSLGLHVIHLGLDDGNGGTDSDSLLVTIQDTVAPSIHLGADVTLEAESAAGARLEIAPVAADACGNVVVSLSPNLSLFPLGSTTLTATATDDSGNVASDSVIVTIVDTTPPVLTVPPDVTAEANGNPLSSVDIGTATATDLVDGEITIVDDKPVGGFPLGPTLVTYSATDARGNSSTGTQNVMVADTTPPELEIPADIVRTASGVLTSVDLGAASATDLFGIAVLENDAPEAFRIGVTQVTWTATDNNSNVARATQQVHLRYGFGGFLPPLSPGGVYRAGRVIPVKIAVHFANGTHAPSLQPMIAVVQLDDGAPTGEPIDVIAVGAASQGNTFVETDAHYQFNLNTDGLGSGTYRILVDLGDGTELRFFDLALR